MPAVGPGARRETSRRCDPIGGIRTSTLAPPTGQTFPAITAGSPEWWAQTRPLAVVISLGAGNRFGFPFVHLDCDFKIPSRMGESINLTLLVEKIGRSSLTMCIVCHVDGLERLRAHMVTAMMSLETRKPVPLPQGLRDKLEAYQEKTAA